MFGERIRQLVERAHPTYPVPDKNQTAIDAFVKGLPTRGDLHVRMNMQDFSSLAEAVDYAAELYHVLTIVSKDSFRHSIRKTTENEEKEDF